MVLTLRQARKMRELSQKKMASALSVCEDTYRKIEINPDLATVGQAKKISKILELSYDALFFDSVSSLTGDYSLI